MKNRLNKKGRLKLKQQQDDVEQLNIYQKLSKLKMATTVNRKGEKKKQRWIKYIEERLGLKLYKEKIFYTVNYHNLCVSNLVFHNKGDM